MPEAISELVGLTQSNNRNRKRERAFRHRREATLATSKLSSAKQAGDGCFRNPKRSTSNLSFSSAINQSLYVMSLPSIDFPYREWFSFIFWFLFSEENFLEMFF
jgi:hypothetical protein